MVIAHITVNASSAKAVSCEPLPIGGCGLQVQFVFDDPAWKKLSKTAVFRNRSKSFNAFLTDGRAVIPHELLTDVTDVLYAGVYGTDTKNALVIPTVWAKLGEISSSANYAADYGAEPTAPYWAQVMEHVDAARSEMLRREDIDEVLLQAKNSGDFDGPPGAPGEKGDSGSAGHDGKDGADGKTPVRGVDYWTDADKAEICDYVNTAILGGAW